MTSYFLRYTVNPQADLERGYSFVGYNLFATKERALETLAEYEGASSDDEFDAETWKDDNDYRIAQDNTTGMWGTRRSGLCGFGDFDSIEEAIENIEAGSQYYANQFAVIFEGWKTYDQTMDGLDDGITFKPVNIAKILEFDGEHYA